MRGMSSMARGIDYSSTTDDLEKYIQIHKKEQEQSKRRWFYQPAYRYTSAEVGVQYTDLILIKI